MSRLSEILRLNIILPLAERIKGTNASYWYRQISRMQSWTPLQIAEWQNAQLRQFIRHAYDHTVYYRRLFDQLHLTPDDIQCPDDLQKLPVITKAIVNQHYSELIPDNISQFRYRKGKTGGTTGEPMLYLCDENTWGYVTAAKIFYWRLAGWHYGERFAALGSASLFGKKASLVRRIYDLIRNEVPMNSVNLDDALCAQYLERIRRQHIHFIYGYAASIFILAQYALRHHIVLDDIRAVFTTSENLTDDYRDTISHAFNCRVVDCYGARDAGITAYETSYHHYQVGYNAIVELVDRIDPLSGTALTTNFLNYSFPLIRYSFGDELSFAESSASYNGQVLSSILGRTADVMRLGNGRNLTATGFSMIMKEFDIVAFDVNQVGDTAVHLRIQPVPDRLNMEQMANIIDTIARYVGEDCELTYELVDQFQPLSNGKRRYFMNN